MSMLQIYFKQEQPLVISTLELINFLYSFITDGVSKRHMNNGASFLSRLALSENTEIS
jgi:hypothetical protein